MLGDVSVFLEDGGEKFQFLFEGVLVTMGCFSVYQESGDRCFVCRIVV
jgi:hypothetical protein